jgi:hypothetical protein
MTGVDKKENNILPIYKEIQKRGVAKSYMRKSFIYDLQLLHSEFPYT